MRGAWQPKFGADERSGLLPTRTCPRPMSTTFFEVALSGGTVAAVRSRAAMPYRSVIEQCRLLADEPLLELFSPTDDVRITHGTGQRLDAVCRPQLLPHSSPGLPPRRPALRRGTKALLGVLGAHRHNAHGLAKSNGLDRGKALRAHGNLLAARAASGAAATNLSASDRASDINWSWGTTQPARPISLARAASIRSPVRSISMAYCQLILCG